MNSHDAEGLEQELGGTCGNCNLDSDEPRCELIESYDAGFVDWHGSCVFDPSRWKPYWNA